MTIGYITRDRSVRSEIGEAYVRELKALLGAGA